MKIPHPLIAFGWIVGVAYWGLGVPGDTRIDEVLLRILAVTASFLALAFFHGYHNVRISRQTTSGSIEPGERDR